MLSIVYFFGKNTPLHCVLDIQIVPQQHHAKFLQRGGDVAPRLSEDAESSDTNPSPKILLQKPHPQKCVLFRKIVLPLQLCSLKSALLTLYEVK